ncbi:TonB-dependent receptor plug domain-containing protein [Reichenbachiella faecimaris]|uniref:TonB-dependent receptor plug domain-containing protein n=1 Tax=Reichenbachiella faecimaris TaxID=692418 RepID=UPI0015941916|nr:TonB-dependent receptor [Reichenbachiella faecimaris]
MNSPYGLYAQKDDLSADELKQLSIEELMSIEVTSVSRLPEKLSKTASAIQVVTGEDILKYGATNIPEALYLAGNLQIAQKGSHSWGVTARGFNTDLANKMLVLIDGRTVYTPLFSGVFWDRQDYLLEDIDQIEVISGPGGTLWGANAVNGVINITSKGAKETQGLFLEGSVGNELKTLVSTRYGGKIAPNIHYRAYAKYGKRDGTVFSDSVDARDSWLIKQGGFRVDAEKENSNFTLQGDLYQNDSDLISGETSEIIGGNVLARWSHTFNDSSNLRLQTYFDQTDLLLPTAPFIVNGMELAPAGTFKDKLTTYDIDFQHRFELGSINRVIWGLGYRHTHDQVTNSPALGFLPEVLKQNLFSIFVQDEIKVFRDFFVAIGTKLEHNDYTGYVLEPNCRIRKTIGKNWMIWSAISRAVRAPSRVDRDITQGTPPNFVLLKGSSEFRTETVIASELGVRGKIMSKGTASVSFFYNQYDHIRSTVLDPEVIFPLTFQNGLEGVTYGFELNVSYQPAYWWQLTTSYTLLHQDLKVKNGQTDFNNTYNETADPEGQFLFRSTFSLPLGISVNGAFRWVDELPINNSGTQETVPSYAELDARVAWDANDKISFSVAGRNLLHNDHIEYGATTPTRQAIERSVYVKMALRF